MTREMATYYARRAAEYDAIYALPQWQRDLEAPGAPVVMFDERETPDRRPRESRRDGVENRYERRRLASGERFEIIKNFYAPARLRELLGPQARDVVYEELDALWLLRYRAG